MAQKQLLQQILLYVTVVIFNLYAVYGLPHHHNNYQNLPQSAGAYGFNDRFYREIQKVLQEKQLDVKNSHREVLVPPKPQEVLNWPKNPLFVGQISGVSVNSKNQPVIFHRADRLWDYDTFDYENNFLQRHKGPITEDTILTLNPETGDIINSWGANQFYIPHGITVDLHDNVWVTDVALHQVFKFKPGHLKPVLELGSPFQPGESFQHFCKPTSVAVATTGEVFIADGYCNHRVLKFNAAGGLLRIIPNPPEFMSLIVPHGLALLEKVDRICIADRENMRVICPRAGLHMTRDDMIPNETENHAPLIVSEPDMGRIFDITAFGNFIYAVNGPNLNYQGISKNTGVKGLTIDPIAESLIDNWSPISGKLQNPHAIAVSPNGTVLYVSEITPNRLWKFSL